MRLVYVAYSPLDLRSANSIQTYNTLRELARQPGVALRVFVPRFSAHDPLPPFPVVRLARIPVNKLTRVWRNGWWSYVERMLYARRVAAVLARLDAPPDLVYTRDLMCAYHLERTGAPVLYEVHDLEARHPGQGKGKRLVEFLERADEQALRRARGVASLTETFRRELVEWGWQDPTRVFVIPDAYDEAVYFPRDKEAARARLGLPREALIVTYAGLTFKYRGLDLLLRAFRLWNEPQARLVLVGGREFEVQALRQEAERLELSPVGNLFPGKWGDLVDLVGRKDAATTAEYLAAADVLVIPATVTEATASPLKMFEYMAMERPIVAVDRPALREILEGAALFFPPGDASALAAALEQSTRPEARRLAEAARARAGKYTYACRAARIVAAAEQVLAP